MDDITRRYMHDVRIMPSKLNFAIKHKAWHYIDNIQNKLVTQEYLSRVTIYF